MLENTLSLPKTLWGRFGHRPFCWKKVGSPTAFKHQQTALSQQMSSHVSGLLTEEYEAYMKEQEVTIKQEVFVVEPEPRAADVPSGSISAEEPTSSALISGQVDQQTFMLFLLITMDTLHPCGH